MQDARPRAERDLPRRRVARAVEALPGAAHVAAADPAGDRPFQAALDEKLLLARYFHEEVQALGFEAGPAPDLSIVTYRWAPPGVEPRAGQPAQPGDRRRGPAGRPGLPLLDPARRPVHPPDGGAGVPHPPADDRSGAAGAPGAGGGPVEKPGKRLAPLPGLARRYFPPGAPGGLRSWTSNRVSLLENWTLERGVATAKPVSQEAIRSPSCQAAWMVPPPRVVIAAPESVSEMALRSRRGPPPPRPCR